MPKGRKRQIFYDCLKCFRVTAAITVLSLVLLFAVFSLYRIMMEPLLYAAILMVSLLIVCFAVTYGGEVKRSKRRFYDMSGILDNWQNLSDPQGQAEADYQVMIETLGRSLNDFKTLSLRDRTEMLDYYTAWVHQIKTPIAVMHLLLAEEDTEKNRALAAELFRVEQYVDMVLQYIRLGSDTNDLVIKEYELDKLIRQSIRKYASQIIARKLSLHYETTDKTIVTDQKWFSVVLEQLLSNAVKYTPSGSITLRVTEDDRLEIEDTGIGIAKTDLKRIFEKGYTGENGRAEQKSSGLGLYLCKKAADKLNMPISVISQPGCGSVFGLDFHRD